MVMISKSTFVDYCRCRKFAWNKMYHPEKFIVTQDQQRRIDDGIAIGKLARNLYPGAVTISEAVGNSGDADSMVKATADEILKGTEVICEAAFRFNDLYCAVDILQKAVDGWVINEVKSVTEKKDDKDNGVKKEIFYDDIAFQKYVVEQCGLQVVKTNLVCLDPHYVRGDELDLSQLFKFIDVTEGVNERELQVPSICASALVDLSSSVEPGMEIHVKCKEDSVFCDIWKECGPEDMSQSVFSLYRRPIKTDLKMIEKGIETFEDCYYNPKEADLSKFQNLQVLYGLNEKLGLGLPDIHLNLENLRTFMDQLTYPLYFLDFETMQPVVPPFKGTHAYQQIPFQYSLHYIEEKGGELKHKEFLAESGTDPRRALAERLCKDIPMDVVTTAYNKKFECGRIAELAEVFPDLRTHLLNIRDNIVDLMDPFSSCWYYRKEIGRSVSIKSVLPAICPNDPELDYHQLDGVHNGTEAMTVFPQIQYMSPEEQDRARNNLLKYCCLDTLAMVKVWEELERVSQ